MADDSDDAEDSTMDTVGKAPISLPWGLADALFGDDDDDDDEEQPAEEDSSGTESALFSLIDKASDAASEIVDDLRSRLEGVVTDIGMADYDGDKIRNKYEIDIGTDPMVMDSDGDGLADGTEVFGGRSDPLVKDTDGDGRSDFRETADGTDPRDKADYDPESPAIKPSPISDASDPWLTDPFDFATGAVADAVGFVAGFPDSDPDQDGLNVREELERGTNPWKLDTDEDGLSDGYEVDMSGTNPLKLDTDDDGLSDKLEDRGVSDPLSADTDGDGVLDGLEHIGGTLGPPHRGFGGAIDDSAGDSATLVADDGSAKRGESILARAAEEVGDLGAAVVDGVLSAPSVAQRFAADVRAKIVDGPLADVVTGLASADLAQIQQEQREDRDAAQGPVPTEFPESSEPNAEDGAIAVPNAQVEIPAPPPILEVPDPIDVEVPVEAMEVEQPRFDTPEPESLQGQVENIDESMGSLTADFDDLTD